MVVEPNTSRDPLPSLMMLAVIPSLPKVLLMLSRTDCRVASAPISTLWTLPFWVISSVPGEIGASLPENFLLATREDVASLSTSTR
ncbi:hypothetical protein D3C77_432520 [compost metagenome]